MHADAGYTFPEVVELTPGELSLLQLGFAVRSEQQQAEQGGERASREAKRWSRGRDEFMDNRNLN